MEDNASSHELLARLHKRNAALVDERNELGKDCKELQHRLRSCEVIIATLVKRLGGDVYISTREQARCRHKLTTLNSKHGVRFIVKGS